MSGAEAGPPNEPAWDVSGLIREARRPAVAAARAYWRQTHPWFVGLVCFGSAVKGGIIAGASDLDFHLYLADAAFTPRGDLPLAVCLAIQRELAAVDPVPFRYMECSPERDSATLDEGHVGFPAGTYHLLAGRMPVPEATAEDLRAQARWALARLDPEPPAFVTEGLLKRGAGRGALALTVRSFTQRVWPVLYQVLALREADPCAVWRAPKERAVALLPADEPMGRAIQGFDRAVRAYYPAEAALEPALTVLVEGTAFLRATAAWAATLQR